MPDEVQNHPERRIRFDGTITAGNVLTSVGMLLALVVWGLRLESRVDMQEKAQSQLERVDERMTTMSRGRTFTRETAR